MDLKFASLPAIGILCNSWSYRLLFCVHSLKITFFPLVLFLLLFSAVPAIRATKATLFRTSFAVTQVEAKLLV